LEGQVTVQAGQGDTVKLSCLGQEGTAGGGASVALSCGGDAGLLKVLQGSVNLIDREGKEANLSEGAEYPIQSDKSQGAPATAAEEPVGGAPLPGSLGSEPPIDSRSIESSPA
jgi:hypothetical protein